MPSYRTINLPLSTERNDVRYDVGATYLVFTRVDGPIYVRFGTGQPQIRISQPETFEFCDGALSDIFVTNTAGAGEVEILATDTVRVGFSAPGASSARPSSVVHVVPGDRSASGINNRSLVANSAIVVSAGAAWGSKTDQFPTVDPDIFGWKGEGSGTGTSQYKARLTMDQSAASQGTISVPLATLLGAGNVNKSGMGWWETETDVYFTASNGYGMFRFGFGNLSAQGVFANGWDVFVGFHFGVMDRSADQSAALGGLSTSLDDLVAVVVSNGDNGGVAGAGRTIHYSKSLGSGYLGTYHRQKVRVGEVGGVVIVEWYLNDQLADRWEVDLSTNFQANTGGTTPLQIAPEIDAVVSDAVAMTADLYWGFGPGWIFRQYVED